MSKTRPKTKSIRVILPKTTVPRHAEPTHEWSWVVVEAAAGASLDMVVKSNPWTPAHDLSGRIFSDAQQASREHQAMMHTICQTPREYFALEGTEWRKWDRLLRTAYLLGICVGARAGKGGER
jgi:hypothetical protein